LDERGELADAAALLAKDFLCVGGADDDVGDGGGDADLDTGVAFLGKLALEELVQLGVEDTVCGGWFVSLVCSCKPPFHDVVCQSLLPQDNVILHIQSIRHS
jgi:hypothetical protein